MISTNSILNDYLGGQVVSKEYFDELRLIFKTVGGNKPIFNWFAFLRSIEIVGWRSRETTKKLTKMLASSQEDRPIEFYALFCPSYKKGSDISGFRTDDVGNTSLSGIENLKRVVDKTKELGFLCKPAKAIFFDVALEQPENTIGQLKDLKVNISNLKSHIPNDMGFELMSEMFPSIFDTVGYKGIKISPLPVPQIVFDRVFERGSKFYKLFGWTDKQILERSEVIASTEALVGNTIRYSMPNSIMVYTPTMLERAQIYSGHRFKTDPLPIIFPKK